MSAAIRDSNYRNSLLRFNCPTGCVDGIHFSLWLFMWHRDHKAVSHCLTAILQMAQT